MIPVPLALNYGQARASVVAGGSLVNMYAQQAAIGAKADIALIGAPGTRLFTQLQYLNDEEVLTNDADVKAIYLAFDKLVVVTGKAVYFVAQDGTWTREANEGLTGPVIMAFNRTGVAAVDGTNSLWITADDVSPIEDEDDDFLAADSVAFLDGYLIFNRAGTGQVYSTGLYAITINAQDFAEAEKSPDNTAGVLAVGDELWIFGTETTERWYNAGNPVGFPFSRISGATIEHGSASISAARKVGGIPYWLTNGGLVVRGAGAERVSDEAVEAALKERASLWSTASAISYADEGHTFYSLTVGDLTITYDASTVSWHQRKNYSRGRALAQCYCQAWGKHFVGDDQGRILEMSGDVYEDAGEPLVAEIVSMPYHANRDYFAVGAVELQMDTGLSAVEREFGVLMEASKDGGRTWGPGRRESIGRTGSYSKRVQWRKLGAFKDARFRFRISDPFRRAVLATLYMVRP